jgi:hypothetical protein
MNKNNIFISFLPQKKHPHYKSKPELSCFTTNHPSFEGNSKLLIDSISKNKQTSPKYSATPSNQNSNFFIFPKSPLEVTNKGYLISSLNSKTETKPEVSSSQLKKNPNHCVIQINILKEKIRFNVDLTNKTSEFLVDMLLEKIQAFDQQNKKNHQENMAKKPIIGFSNTSGFILIDYILTLKNVKLDFLHNMIIIFNPIYADVHFLKSKTSKQSLKNFDFLRLIGSGGFSKVFLGKITFRKKKKTKFFL